MNSTHTIEIREYVNDEGSIMTSIAIFESEHCRYLPKYKFELLQSSNGLSLYYLPSEDMDNIELMTDDEQFQIVIELINAIVNLSNGTQDEVTDVRLFENLGFKGKLALLNADLSEHPIYKKLDKRLEMKESQFMRDLREFLPRTLSQI